MCKSNLTLTETAAQDVGDAVGVSTASLEPPQHTSRHWYIAIVDTNQEKATRDRLQHLGYESFVATQREIHYWNNGKRKIIEVVKITNIVFILCTEHERRIIVHLPYIKHFMVNKAGTPSLNGFRPIATIPDCQMQILRQMLYQAELPFRFASQPITLGAHVRIIRGNMLGFEGHVVQMRNTTDKYIGIKLDFLGCAMLQISPNDIENIA